MTFLCWSFGNCVKNLPEKRSEKRIEFTTYITCFGAEISGIMIENGVNMSILPYVRLHVMIQSN
jgi:hypothetical protein